MVKDSRHNTGHTSLNIVEALPFFDPAVNIEWLFKLHRHAIRQFQQSRIFNIVGEQIPYCIKCCTTMQEIMIVFMTNPHRYDLTSSPNVANMYSVNTCKARS